MYGDRTGRNPCRDEQQLSKASVESHARGVVWWAVAKVQSVEAPFLAAVRRRCARQCDRAVWTASLSRSARMKPPLVDSAWRDKRTRSAALEGRPSFGPSHRTSMVLSRDESSSIVISSIVAVSYRPAIPPTAVLPVDAGGAVMMADLQSPRSPYSGTRERASDIHRDICTATRRHCFQRASYGIAGNNVRPTVLLPVAPMDCGGDDRDEQAIFDTG